MQIYAVAMVAFKNDLIGIKADSVLAANSDVANQQAVSLALKEFPESAGWEKHEARIMYVDRNHIVNWVRGALLSFYGDGVKYANEATEKGT